MSKEPHHVVVVGAGFGGLEFTRAIAKAPVRVTLIDQRNHHLFQPLLYQVATTSLATSEIAWPIRHLVRREAPVTTLLATVNGVDTAGKRVLLTDGGAIPYDTLVLATGARHSYFGRDEWEAFAPGLKTLEDATTIRRRILLAFERAERETDSRTAAGIADLRDHRRWADWRGTGRDHRRTGPRDLARRIPQHRYARHQGRADRSG